MKFTLPLDSTTALFPPPYQPNDIRWTGQGDPRPYVVSNTIKTEAVVEKGTPYTMKLNAKASSSDGKGQGNSNSFSSAATPSTPYVSFTIPPTVASLTHPKDKCQLTLPTSLAYLDMNLAMRRYIGFDMMVDPSFQLPAFGAFSLWFQAWQCCLGVHPPFEMEVVPSSNRNGAVQLRFFVRDDAGEIQSYRDLQAGRTQTGQQSIGVLGVTRGDWNEFIFQMQPRYNGSTIQPIGQIAIWLNGVMRILYRGDWGYKPLTGLQPITGATIHNIIQFGIGPYRHCQGVTQKASFRNIRFAGTFAEVE